MGNSTKKSTAIGILGMHRSGTSLVTRIVNLLGAYVGETDELMQVRPDNPEGFWEHKLVYDFHERLLEAVHRTWDTAIPLPPGWHESKDIAVFRDELIELIETRYGAHPLWSWKDPRSSILLPLWKDALEQLDIELRCLLVVRNPLDVARSLQVRNNFSLDDGFGLWLNHSLAMLQNSAGLPRVLVSYQRLLADPEASISNWAPQLSLRWAPDDESLLNAIRQAVHPDLCHSASTFRDLSRMQCPKPVLELAEILDDIVNRDDVDNSVYEPKIRRLLETHSSLSGLYAHDFVQAQAVNQELHQQLAEREDLAKEAQAQAQEERDRLAELRSQIAKTEQSLAEARVQQETTERRLQARDREISAAQGRLAEFERELAEGRIQRQTAELQLQLREGEIAAIVETSAGKKRELEEARELLKNRDVDLMAVEEKAEEIWMQLLAEREEAKQRSSADEQELVHVRGVLEERDQQFQSLLSDAENMWNQLETERAEYRVNLDRIYSTYSWRITAPLRAILDSLKTVRHRLIAVRRKLDFRIASPIRRLRRRKAMAPVDEQVTGAGGPAPAVTPDGLDSPKVIAFYLPQFHPIPENDGWWGKGFTEWTNVVGAHPLYEGHHQPRQPADLGYYDLRLPEVREAQAELARAHGIHGFCYHYYWFDRDRLLERPLNDMLDSGRPDFPFCLSWANESWTRRWDGSEKDVLMAQNYNEGFAERFAEDAVPYLKDPRYIRIGNRPLLIVYRVDLIPNIEQVVDTWRQSFREQGVGEVMLAAVECFDVTEPTRFGFDVAIEFPPHNPPLAENRPIDPTKSSRVENLDPEFNGLLRDYRDAARARAAMKPTGYPLFRGVMPSWDNTARTGPRAMIYHHASPDAYQEWLTTVLTTAPAFSAPHEPFVFVNAWNEWAEGAYLEPDQNHGHDYLLATKAAVDAVRSRAGVARLGGANHQKPPDISIIIPVFNQAHLTRSCLDSLYRHNASVPFEVIVVDDASTDDTPAIADDMPWVRYLRQDENRGFGSTCNLGAKQARGKYLVFLNNDTTVCDGWLDALYETFDYWPKAGLVGSKLVLMDGKLQECGGLVFRDGTAANFGHGQDPSDPRYCYARETDYVSGAAMMIRSDLFRELEGFDPRYEPAYYEDTDLALRVREKGLQVVVNPHAVVNHHEGGTAGKDTSKGIKRYQVINEKKFLDRWLDVLSHYPVRPTGRIGPGTSGPRVMVIDDQVPHPDRDSGSLRMAGILSALRRLGCHVTVAGWDLRCDEGYELPLERIGVEVLRSPYVESIDKYLIDEGKSFDYVIVSRRDVARKHMQSVERHCSNATIVFDTVDLHFVREARQAELGESDVSPARLAELKALELDLAARSDVTFVVSELEQDAIRAALPQQDVRVVSNIVETRPTPRHFDDRAGLLFIGWFPHTPNVGAVLWFAKEVLPELNRMGFHPVLHVIGSYPPDEVLALQSAQIKIHGFVPDVEPFFDECLLSVAPLQTGAGVKGKINQSLALGLPCVTTSVGAEGMFIEDGVNCLIADEPAAFAAHIHSACHSKELWTTMREQGLRSIEAHYSPAVAEAALRDFIRPTSGSVSGEVSKRAERKKIVLVAHDAHPHGAQYLSLNLAKTLHCVFGYDVSLVVLGEGILLPEYSRWATVHSLAGVDHRGTAANALARQLAAQGNQAAIANTTVSGLFLATLADAGLRCISLVHELRMIIDSYELHEHAAVIAQRAETVVFATEQVAGPFLELAKVPQERVLVRPQGLYKKNAYLGDRVGARTELRATLGVGTDARIVLGVGYLDYRKGVDLFVEAGLKVVESMPDAYFVWVGHWESGMKKQIDAMLDGRASADRFLFVGRKDDTDIYFAGADVFVLSSREDPFPSTIMESLEVGLPVIGFRGAGGAETLLDRGCGVLVTLEDIAGLANAISGLLNNPDQARKLGDTGASIVQGEFSFRHYVYDLLELTGRPVKRVSAIVPNYNYARHLEQRLRSIISQTYPVFEIIVLDDASTDDSVEVIKTSLATTAIDCRLVKNDENSGSVFKQWQKGLQLASGDFVWICEADDFAEPSFLQEAVRSFDHDGVVLSYTQSKQIDDEGSLIEGDYLEYTADICNAKWTQDYVNDGSKELAQALAIKNTIPNVSAVVFRKTALEQALRRCIDDVLQLKIAGDWLVYSEILQQGRIGFNSKSLNQHRRHRNSVTLDASNNEQHMAEILYMHDRISHSVELDETARKKAIQFAKHAFSHLKLGSSRQDPQEHAAVSRWRQKLSNNIDPTSEFFDAGN